MQPRGRGQLAMERLAPRLAAALAVLRISSTAAVLRLPAPFPPSNGGYFSKERKVPPAGGTQPHIALIVLDDFGWNNAGWHDASADVKTPGMDALVREGIELERHYVFKYCAPTRSALQSGRSPYHVNPLNSADCYNPENPSSGAAGIPRNMTGLAVKLAAAGYTTYMFGKWDVGFATPDHTPNGRGFKKSLHYFHHDNDYWDQKVGGCDWDGHEWSVQVVDLWQTNIDGPGQGPADQYNNSCSGNLPNVNDDRDILGQSCYAWGVKSVREFNGYEDALFAQQVMRSVLEHNTTSPYFLYWAPHIVHTPLQVPAAFFNRFDFIEETDLPSHERQTYHAMVNFADAAILNFTHAAKRTRLYDDLLIIFMSDNGGPVYFNGAGGANNYPLKGGKMSNWDGGIRANAWVSGGFLPTKVRGTKYSGLVTAWDWYATISLLAGIEPTDWRAAAAGLPPIDSQSMVPVLLGTGNSTRDEIAIGTEPRLVSILGQAEEMSTLQGVIKRFADGSTWKLLIGFVEQSGWTSPRYPNETTNTCCFNSILQNGAGRVPEGGCPRDDPCVGAGSNRAGVTNCTAGCLFLLSSDEGEHTDLSLAQPELVGALMHRVEALKRTAFLPKRCTCDDGFGSVECLSRKGSSGPQCADKRACDAVISLYGGFWGPWVDV